MQATTSCQLSLGPISYYWPKQQVLDFYQQLQSSPISRIYLGETVCRKRNELRLGDYLDLGRELQQQGKEVLLSTMTLLETQNEVLQLTKAVDNGELQIEANDFAAVQLCMERKLPFVAGPSLNIYNEDALELLLNQGMSCWVPPIELSQQRLEAVLNSSKIANRREQFELEIFALGHIPLAWSARCFTARSLNRSKDNCQLCCLDYPSGRLVNSQEGEPLFVLNGIQTQSGKRHNLINDLPSLMPMAQRLRLSPQAKDMGLWIERFAKGIERLATGQDGLTQGLPSTELLWPLEANDCNGYWRQLAGMEAILSAEHQDD